MSCLGIIAGNGYYPLLLAREARAQGVKRIVVAAFINETRPELEALADQFTWLRVGQLGKLIHYFSEAKVDRAMMAGQIAPSNLFDLLPDFKALLVLAKLKERNAETIFSAIAQELEKVGTTLLPATTYLDSHLAPLGLITGPALKKRQEEDVQFGFRIAKEVSRLDIGQTVVVKKGTVLAVEGFEGTDRTLRRGGDLGRGDAVAIKVSKPNQDFRFDVPVVGTKTLETAHEAGIRVIACEAGKTLLLEREALAALAQKHRITLVGV